MLKSLAQKLDSLPRKPGVYIYKDEAGMVLYVGKAINLRSRVSSYFKKGAEPDRPHIQVMIPQIADLDYTVTSNELESFMLESNFIKQLKPRYNIMLRDDKNYMFLKINLHDEIPTVEYERRIIDRHARYFGPYTSGQAIKETLRLVRKVFPYCANSKLGGKPCFFYHIGKCPGVCFGKISLADYRDHYIQKIIKFLLGKQTEVLKELQIQMREYARNKQFEKAAKTRDQIFALNRILERQKIVSPRKISQDVFGVYQAGTVSCINLFIVREGKLIRKENFVLDNTKGLAANEILDEFLPRYYSAAADHGKEVVRSGKSYRGPKLQLLKLCEENAKQYLESLSDKHLLEEARLLASLRELQRVLDLPKLPGRIEAFDISNIQGTNPVGSMVVFDFGRPKKSDYRKFKIRIKQTPDDFAMMREMLTRRFRNSWPLPDLILIDGGKGQLSAALKALKQFQILDSRFRIPIMGLAKRLEEIFLPLRPKPYTLLPNSQALFLLQRVRDEAHRFAITFHRHLRSRKSLTSALDEISGLGPAKKKRLLAKFGSARQIQNASLTDLGAIVGHSLAEKIKATL